MHNVYVLTSTAISFDYICLYQNCIKRNMDLIKIKFKIQDLY